MTQSNQPIPGSPALSFAARPERRLIRRSGSFRHVDFATRVEIAASPTPIRRPVRLALVLDRSGSMGGEKLEVAKRVALSIVDRLDDRDEVSVVVYDDRIDVIQVAAPVNSVIKARLRASLGRIEPRGSTALHEGWLTGCQTIAAESARPSGAIARCFLLTDGLANVGETDPERIAQEAAGIREHAGIGTSTFGIGFDYNEDLLSPLAKAGGGEFYNIQTMSQLAGTFIGELGDMLSVVAGRVRLEIEADPGITADVVSQYWVRPATAGLGRWTVDLSDLIAGDDRHVIVRCGFPAQRDDEEPAVRGRLVWREGDAERSTPWEEVRFRYAGHAACDEEVRDADVMHWVGLAHADRARREAAERSRRGDLDGAKRLLRRTSRRLREYVAGDPDLQGALQELSETEAQVAEIPASPALAKELYYQTQLRSRGKRDRRGS